MAQVSGAHRSQALGVHRRDLDPIEQVFSKLKHLLRKAQARSCDAVLSVIDRTLRTYAPDECRNYFCNSGYGVA